MLHRNIISRRRRKTAVRQIIAWPWVTRRQFCCRCLAGAVGLWGGVTRGAGDQQVGEITQQSRQALRRGLQWLAANQGPSGNWGSEDLGLVSLGMLAFLADGHFPRRGPYGVHVERALDFVLSKARPNGLLNIAHPQRDMYNHGLSTFVLAQAYGMSEDPRLGPALERALRLIADTQCGDGGWDYRAARLPQGHDLSLAVMQANALRSAVDSGFEVSPQVVELAIRSVRQHYRPDGMPAGSPEHLQRLRGGQFVYRKQGRGNASTAMAAAGVVCLQEFGEYNDWRIEKNMAVIAQDVRKHTRTEGNDPPELAGARGEDRVPMDPYTLYYVAQAIYQVGNPWWKELYPELRDMLVRTQVVQPQVVTHHGRWRSVNPRVSGRGGELFATAVGCFVLAIPNRYLPILQEGRIQQMQGGYK